MTQKRDRVILEGSERTAFTYRIDGGMDERDREEIESMDSGYVLGLNWPSVVSDSVDLHHRMNYIRNRNLGFGYIGMSDQSFQRELERIDKHLPVTLAFMVADFYRNGVQRVTDLLENTTRKNPAGLNKLLETKPYDTILKKFVEDTLGERVSLDDCFLEKIPADKFGCASISGNKEDGYTIKLVLKLVLKPSIRA